MPQKQPAIAVVREDYDPKFVRVLISDTALPDVGISLSQILVSNGIDLARPCKHRYETIGEHGYHVFQQSRRQAIQAP